MERELRDELEVPGHVIMIKAVCVKDNMDKAKQIIDKYEKLGVNTLGGIPEGEDKDELRRCFREVGVKIKF
jgi:hypothetical protein